MVWFRCFKYPRASVPVDQLNEALFVSCSYSESKCIVYNSIKYRGDEALGQNYSQLSQKERDQIAIYRSKGHSFSVIGKVLGRNGSTISREYNRITGVRAKLRLKDHGSASLI